MFGVFGPGEVYQQTLNTLATDPVPQRRAYAAYALGEFLEGAGIPAVATALRGDSDAGVRAAAASALGRLNDDGAGALGAAFGDSDAHVKFVALTSAGRVNSFTGIAGVAALTGDADPAVRRQALLLLGDMGAKDSIASVMAVAKGDADYSARIAACHALGSFGDMSAMATLQGIAANDSNGLVRDAAKLAILRL
jgi:HEAT repeat protein